VLNSVLSLVEINFFKVNGSFKDLSTSSILTSGINVVVVLVIGAAALVSD
jgi:hypothetical protein